MDFIMFDVESNGLYGDGFAVAAVVIKNDKEVDNFILKSKYDITEDFVKNNVLPSLEGIEECDDIVDMRNRFWKFIKKYDELPLITDCAYPVETSFLRQCVMDDETRQSQSPYLYDINILIDEDISREDIVNNSDIVVEGSQHNPLYDSRMSAYALILFNKKIQEKYK